MLAETAKNETLICPLCKGVFRDPHIATCGVNPVIMVLQHCMCSKALCFRLSPCSIHSVDRACRGSQVSDLSPQ